MDSFYEFVTNFITFRRDIKNISFLVKFNEILSLYQVIFPMEEDLSSTGNENFSQGIDQTGMPGVSPPQQKRGLQSRKMDLNALFKWLEEKKWEFCIWISKIDRDHNFQAIGKLNENDLTFKKIESGLNLRFSNSNGRANVVKSTDGLNFSWQLTNTGHNHFWLKDGLSWELFVQNLLKVLEPCKLTSEEFGALTNCLQDIHDKKSDVKLFRLETANNIGPRDIIEESFDKACLIYQQVYHRGQYYPILIKIDKSKGPYEIEFVGPYGPTRAMQDVTVRALETVESLGHFEFILENLVDQFVQSHETIRETYNIAKYDIASYLSEIDANNENRHLQTRWGLESVKSSVIKNGRTLQVVQSTLQNELIPGLKSELDYLCTEINKSQLEQTDVLIQLSTNVHDLSNNTGDLIVNLNDIKDGLHDKIESAQNHNDGIIFDTTNEIKDKLSLIKEENDQNFQKIETKIDQWGTSIEKKIQWIHSRFSNLITEEFTKFGNKVQNNLVLVLGTIFKFPGLSSKEIVKKLQETTSLSRSSIYRHVKELRDQDLIENISMKIKKGPGRPSSFFSLSKKTKEFIKKLKTRGN